MTPIVTADSAAASMGVDQAELRTSYHQTYHEISDRHVVETDVIEQLRANIAQLEDLHGRMRFMMSEVAYLLKKS